MLAHGGVVVFVVMRTPVVGAAASAARSRLIGQAKPATDPVHRPVVRPKGCAPVGDRAIDVPAHTTTGTGDPVVLVADRGAGGLGPADRAETARTGQQLPIRLLGLPPAYDAALNTQHRGWPTRRDSKIKVHSRTLGRSTRCGWYSAVGVRVAMSSSTSPSKLRSCRASCWRWKHSVLTRFRE